jgi:probable FeS assembly SUF system protein SufT
MWGGKTTTVVNDCPGILVPAGTEVVIPEGTDVQITQAMGGSITVHIGGNLVRVAGRHAEALGLDPVVEEPMPENPRDEEFAELVEQQLRTCFDPEIPINIVDLGLVYKRDIEKREDGKRDVSIDMTLTAPGCGMGEILVADVRDKLGVIPTLGETKVELVFDPPWNPALMSDEAKLQTGMF